MKHGRRLFVGVALLLLAASAYMQLCTGNASDKNWLLEAAHKWVNGGRLYIDIFEIDPPLIVWLYAIPEWISSHYGLSASALLGGMGLLFSGLSILLCTYLIRFHPAFEGNHRRQTDFALLLAYVLIFFIAPMYFADREHVFLTLTLPYILRFSPQIAQRRPSGTVRFVIGLLAAVGFCIKPHTIVVFIAMQLICILRERSFRILWSVENIIIYILGGAYLASILLSMPEYVHTVLPMALATYAAYSRKIDGVYSIVTFLIITGIAFADFRPRHTSPYRRDIWYFLGICGAYIAYGLVNNGWAYTYIPLLSMARFLAGWLLLEFLWLKNDSKARGEAQQSFTFGIISSGASLTLNVVFYAICFVAYLLPVNCEKNVTCKGAGAFLQQARAHPVHSFGTMSLGFYKWPELAREIDADWDTRFNHLWMLPEFLLQGPEFRQKNAWIIDYVGKAYGYDLDTHKPEIIYVDVSPLSFKGHGPIDYIGFFGDIPEFKSAWSHYRRTDTINACVRAPRGEPLESSLRADCKFDIYSRTSAP